jgi:hypothetical protein
VCEASLLNNTTQGGGGRAARPLEKPGWTRRRKGVPNKITRDIREGCIAGFAAHGLDGKGKLGFPGYIQFLATKHPKTASRLIEKLLPFVVNTPGFRPPPVATLNIVSIESGSYLSSADIAHLQQQSDPHAIDHVPALEHHNEPAPVKEPIVEVYKPPTEQERSDPTPSLAALEAKLLALGHDELFKLAETLGVGRG